MGSTMPSLKEERNSSRRWQQRFYRFMINLAVGYPPQECNCSPHKHLQCRSRGNVRAGVSPQPRSQAVSHSVLLIAYVTFESRVEAGAWSIFYVIKPQGTRYQVASIMTYEDSSRLIMVTCPRTLVHVLASTIEKQYSTYFLYHPPFLFINFTFSFQFSSPFVHTVS